MAGPKDGAILEPIRALFGAGGAAGSSDAELLDRFEAGGSGADAAFGVLLERHGPMVLAVCRRLAGDRTAADDAFQATFLALIRRSGSIRVRGSLAPWLFAVARRIAHRARRRAIGRREAPCPADFEAIDPTSPADSLERLETSRILFEEIGRLPERYRAPLVLCHVEGRTHDQAATDLGWPVGTVRGRLSRARVLLRDRLHRRGVGVTAGALLAGLRREVVASLLPSLVSATMQLTRIRLAGRIAAGVVPAVVFGLEKGAFPMIGLTQINCVLGGTLLLGVAAATFGQGPAIPGAAVSDQDPVPALEGRAVPTEQVEANDSADQPELSKLMATLEQGLRRNIRAWEINSETNLDIMVRIENLDELRRARPVLDQILQLGPITLGSLREIRPNPNDTTEDAFSIEEDAPQATVEVSGNDHRADSAIEVAEAETIQGIIAPAVERFERIFAEKAAEAMELEAASQAWLRMNAMPAEVFEGESDVAKLLSETREKFRERLESFAGRPEDAPEASDRIQSELMNLAGVHAALLGVEDEPSWAILGTATLKVVVPHDPDAPQRPGFINRDVQRVQAFFSRLGIQLHTAVTQSGEYIFTSGGLRGMGEMGSVFP